MTQLSIETINDNTSMIDMELFGVKRAGALYLIKGDKTCILDSGTKKEAKGLIKALDSIEAFPPDMIIITHSHYDHSQGVPVFCREAEKRGKKITIMASEKAIPNLQDQSWNSVFDEKHKYENIFLAHFGCLQGEEAKNFPNETVDAYETWWNIFVESEKKGKLDDVTYMRETIITEVGIEMPEIEIGKASMRIMLSLINTGKKIFGKKPIDVGEVQLEGFINWLVKGYRGSTQ
jgi:metal-dependent hydrolase (beta-lactamase superfamily II)